MRPEKRSLTLKAAVAAVVFAPALAMAAWTPADNPVTSNSELREAMNDVQSGQEIVLGAGLTFAPSSSIQFTLNTGANGGRDVDAGVLFGMNNKSNITIRGASSTNRPKIVGETPANYEESYQNYGLFINNSNNILIKDIIIEKVAKGLLLDNTHSSTVDNVEIRQIGHEGFHWRDTSSNNILRNSTIKRVGLDRRDRGEAVYVCNDKKMWHPHPEYYNMRTTGDKDFWMREGCDDNIIENNILGPDIGAEAVDIKEGVYGTIVRNNTVYASITDNELDNNSHQSGSWAPSVIHDKGANSRIHDNTIDLAGMIWHAQDLAEGAWLGAIRVEAVLDDDNNGTAEVGWDVFGHGSAVVHNDIVNDNAVELIGYMRSNGSAKFGCNTQTAGGSTEDHKWGSKAATPWTQEISGSTCDGYVTAGTGGGSSTGSTSSTSTTGSTSGSTTSSSGGSDFDSANWNSNSAEPGQTKKSVNLSYSSGQVNAAITATDPYIRWDETANVDGHDQVKVKVLNNAGGGLTDFKVFFQKGSSWYSKEFTVPNDNTWKWKTIDMSSISAWSGNINKLRLDGPHNATSGNFKLDFVQLIANSGGSTTSSTGSTSSTSSGGGSCLTYAYNSGLKELTFPSTSGGCVDITGGSLNGSEVAIADSDANTSCDIRGTATGSSGSHTIDANWEVTTTLSGTTLNIATNNGCKYFKLRIRP